jgi:hypothetical protein
MTVHGGAKVVLTAATGIYQSQTQLLDLFDGVTLTHQYGTRRNRSKQRFFGREKSGRSRRGRFSDCGLYAAVASNCGQI